MRGMFKFILLTNAILPGNIKMVIDCNKIIGFTGDESGKTTIFSIGDIRSQAKENVEYILEKCNEVKK